MALAIDRSELDGAEIVDQVLLIPVDQIDEGERLRAVDPVWAEAIGHLMQRDGQKKDIEVCRLPGATRFTLVDGAHRLAGARQLGIAHLRAQLVSANREERRLREIMAQLGHRGLTDPLDRAAFVAELVLLKRAQAGLTDTAHRDASVKKAVRIETDRTMETISNVYGWSDVVGAELGLTGRTIRNDLMLFRGIAPSLVARLRSVRHPVLRNAGQLKRLAQLSDADQSRTVDTLLDYPGLTTVAAARAHLAGGSAARDPEAKRLSAFIGAFARMSVAEKKAALSELAGMLPAGFRLEQGPKVASALSPDHARYREEALAAIDSAREVIDGILEDDILPGDRGSDLRNVSSELQLTRFTICGDGFDLGRAA